MPLKPSRLAYSLLIDDEIQILMIFCIDFFSLDEFAVDDFNSLAYYLNHQHNCEDVPLISSSKLEKHHWHQLLACLFLIVDDRRLIYF